MVVAMAAEEVALWEVALGIGAVVIIVVIALLGMLLSMVRAIQAGAGDLLAVGGAVAENSRNIPIALTVADDLDVVAAEAGRHAQLLGVKL